MPIKKKNSDITRVVHRATEGVVTTGAENKLEEARLAAQNLKTKANESKDKQT